MKAAVVKEFGQPPESVDVAEPVPGDGTVIAEVRAAAVKNIERMLVAGTHYDSARRDLPARVGIDAVVTLPDGRRVYAAAAPPSGAMAERMLVDPQTVIDLPDEVDDRSAAALPNAAVSAWFALEYAGRIRPGQNVLVLGGTGVTGSLAVQLAKHQFDAARVVVAGRNAERLRRLCELGADETIRIEQRDPDDPAIADTVARMHEQQPFDVVVDYLWGRPAEQTLRALAGDDLAAAFHRTRYVQVGEMAGSTIELPAAALRSAGIELVGQGGGSVPREAFARVVTDVLPTLFAMLAKGTIEIQTLARPLSEVADVWTHSTPPGVRIVLAPT